MGRRSRRRAREGLREGEAGWIELHQADPWEAIGDSEAQDEGSESGACIAGFAAVKQSVGMRRFFGGCAAIRYNFSGYIEGNLSRGVVISVVSEPELKIDALP